MVHKESADFVIEPRVSSFTRTSFLSPLPPPQLHMASSGRVGRLISLANQAIKSCTSEKTYDHIIRSVRITNFAEDASRMTAELTVAQEHLNRAGTIHGGCTTTLIDELTGFNFLAHRGDFETDPSTSVQLEVKFLTPAVEGDVIEIHSTVVKAGKRLYFLKADLYNRSKEDKIIATGQHILSIDPKAPPPKGIN